MASHNKTLQLIASKLGLGDEEKVLRKAAELERLLQTKSTAGSNMTDTSKVVICLDLAANMYRADLDVKMAIKYSGLKSLAYNNCRKMVENILELNTDGISTTALCLTLQCSGVQELADRILSEYKRQAKMEVDVKLPQYVCMAVYQACRLSKVKVSKSKLIEKSRLKPSQWTKLDADWSKFVGEKFKTIGKQTKTIADIVEDQDMEVDEVDQKTARTSEPKIEPYEEWKQRMLEMAYKELAERQRETSEKRELGNKFLLSPRRSPRKTPQKYSPYKSPSKSKGGVRLLFPVGM